MPAYRLHCFAQSGNCYKVALYLNCAGLEWEPVFVDYFNNATRAPDYRANLNAMGEAPVLEADGVCRTQSGAILNWLAEATGKFAPSGSDGRYEALRWILFDNHKFTGNLATYRFMNVLAAEPPKPDVAAFLKSRADAAYAIVDKHLADKSFMLGKSPTIADFSLAGYVFYPAEETGIDLPISHPNIYAWAERLKALKGWKPPYEIMPGKRFKAAR
jgi:glutathione S-transferase